MAELPARLYGVLTIAGKATPKIRIVRDVDRLLAFRKPSVLYAETTLTGEPHRQNRRWLFPTADGEWALRTAGCGCQDPAPKHDNLALLATLETV